MNLISQFRREEYGLFLDYTDAVFQKISIPASGENVLIDLPTTTGGVLGGVIDSAAFSSFSFTLPDNSTMEIGINYSNSRRMSLGLVEFTEVANAVQWCIEATGLLESKKNESKKSDTAQQTEGPSTVEFWNLCRGGYFEKSTRRWAVAFDEVNGSSTSKERQWIHAFGKILSDKRTSNHSHPLSFIFGIGNTYAELLDEADVRTFGQLANRKPMSLTQDLRELVRAAQQFSRPPLYQDVVGWVFQAKLKQVLDSSSDRLDLSLTSEQSRIRSQRS